MMGSVVNMASVRGAGLCPRATGSRRELGIEPGPRSAGFRSVSADHCPADFDAQDLAALERWENDGGQAWSPPSCNQNARNELSAAAVAARLGERGP